MAQVNGHIDVTAAGTLTTWIGVTVTGVGQEAKYDRLPGGAIVDLPFTAEEGTPITATFKFTNVEVKPGGNANSPQFSAVASYSTIAQVLGHDVQPGVVGFDLGLATLTPPKEQPITPITPPPPQEEFPKFDGNPVWLPDWIKWLGNVIKWLLGNLLAGIGAALSPVIQLFWDLLPSSVRDFITKGTDALVGFYSFISTPQAFVRKAVAGLVAEPAPSPVTDLQSAYQKVGIDLRPPSIAEKHPQLAGWVTGIYKDIIAGYLARIIAVITQQELSAVDMQAQLQDLAIQAASDVNSIALEYQFLPLENLSMLPQIAAQALDYLGIDSLRRDYIDNLIRASAGIKFQHAANKMFKLGHPPDATLTSLWAKGSLARSELDSTLAETAALSTRNIDLILDSQRAPPVVDDLITYNRRHPDKALDLELDADLVGLDFIRFPEVLLERQWSDIPVRTLKALYQAGSLDENDADIGIVRQGFRKDKLPGQHKSDFQVMHDYITAGLQGTLNKSLLLSTERLYLLGEKAESELRTAAEKVYPDATELDTYMQTAANRLALSELRPKHFSYLQLIKFADAGIDISKVQDADIKATLLDDDHQAILKQYIDQTIAAKKQAPTK